MNIYLFVSDYKFEKLKSTDWIGMLLFVTNLGILGIFFLLPLATVVMDLDPAYYIFELFLPSRYERNLTTIILAVLLRWFLFMVVVLEFLRFGFMIVFFLVVLAFTAIKCVNQTVNCSHRSERVTLKLYMQLRIILKVGDHFIRHLIALLLIFAQVLITATAWMVLMCRHILPIPIYLVACLALILATVAVLVLFPCAVKITETSRKFVLHKMALHHTFNRFHKNYYYFIKWRSKRLLAIRCGEQFILKRTTELGYYQILMTNLTNAILLVRP